jgi:hypothetical protein
VRLSELEHVIRAAAAITGLDDIVVVGSQAVLGSARNAPDALLLSVDADIYPRDDPARAIEIDGAIGEGSLFFDTFGYHAHGVGPETVVAPTGWKERLVPFSSENTRGATAWCLEPHDLCLAKAVAAREKDWSFITAAVSSGTVEPQELERRWLLTALDEDRRAALTPLLEAAIARGRRGGGP